MKSCKEVIGSFVSNVVTLGPCCFSSSERTKIVHQIENWVCSRTSSSLDSAFLEFHLFGALKDAICRMKFGTDEDVIQRVRTWLREQDRAWYWHDIHLFLFEKGRRSSGGTVFTFHYLGKIFTGFKKGGSIFWAHLVLYRLHYCNFAEAELHFNTVTGLGVSGMSKTGRSNINYKFIVWRLEIYDQVKLNKMQYHFNIWN